MKNIKKIIKGVLLTIILISVLSLSSGVLSENNNVLSDYFTDKAYAQANNNDDELLNLAGKAVTEGQTSAYLDQLGTGKNDNTASDTTTGSGASDAELSKLADQAVSPTTGGNSNASGNTEAKLPQDTLKSIAEKSQIIFKVFHPAIFFLTQQISNFLQPDLIFEGGMGQNLQKIWVICRNIVNISFVLIMLYFAIRYIFGDEKTDLKKFLPTFALMLVLVNFSWLGSKLIVDAANVVTNVAFAIPNGIGPLQTIKSDENKCYISANGKSLDSYECQPKAAYIPFDATTSVNEYFEFCSKLPAEYKKAYPEKGKVDKSSPYYGKATLCWGDLDVGKFDSSNAAFQLTYSMARVQNLPLAQAEDIPHLAIGTIFALFFEIVYLLSFGALFIVLVFRMVFLWIMVAFSPIIVLFMFIEKSGIIGAPKEAQSYLSLSEFSKWAFAPAKVAIVWAVGFIMITTGQTASQGIFDKLNAQSSVNVQVFSVSSVFMGMNSVQDIIWLLMTMMIIWTGTFAMMKDLKIAGGVVEKINKAGTDVFKTVASIPTAAPIIPTIDIKEGKLDFHKRTSLSSATDIGGKIRKSLGMDSSSRGDVNDWNMIDTLKKVGKEDVKAIEGIKDNKDAAKKFSSVTGWDMGQISGLDEKKLAEGLKDRGAVNPADLARKIKEGAKESKGTLPGTATPPSGDSGKQTYEAVKKGVEDALKGKKFSDADKETIIKEVDKMRQDTGGELKDIASATSKAVEKLNKEGVIKLPKDDTKASPPATPPAATPPAAPKKTPPPAHP